jgi:hypothetical protein
VGKESGATNETHGEWLVVQRKKKVNNKSKINCSQPSSLANKLPKNVGKEKGQQLSPSLKGASDTNRTGVGPNQMNTNPKKRRIDRGASLGVSRQHNMIWDPHVKDKTNTIPVPRMHNTRKNQNVISSPANVPSSTSILQKINIEPEGGKGNQTLLHNLNLAPDANASANHMDEGNTQDDECVPESPIVWERTE